MKPLLNDEWAEPLNPSLSSDGNGELTSGMLNHDIDPTDLDVFSLEDLEWVNNIDE